ncbi:heme ABC transporter ATP-binding protein [Panacagrimonas sp.]|uniref:heme ABC transporter ATP-binding protein n=1 Tax=Panacagrimonas sp. TaxID=2480088 RepID=UPI003B525F06
MLLASDVSVMLGARSVLTSVDLQLQPGQVLAVLGPNGAGKSTLLKVLSGEIQPCGGQVLLFGRPMSQWPARELARTRAVLPQTESLRFGFGVEQVVALGRMPWTGDAPAATVTAISAALELAGIANLRHRIYTQLSAGERARVQLARVVAQIWNPLIAGARLLLLDEPTASLDLAHQHEVLGAVRRLAQQNVGVVMVVHDLNLAMRYADTVLMLANGKPAHFGAVADVLTAPHIESVYGIAVELLWRPGDASAWIVPQSSGTRPTTP